MEIALTVAVDGHLPDALLDHTSTVGLQVFDVDRVGAHHGDEILVAVHGV